MGQEWDRQTGGRTQLLPVGGIKWSGDIVYRARKAIQGEGWGGGWVQQMQEPKTESKCWSILTSVFKLTYVNVNLTFT